MDYRLWTATSKMLFIEGRRPSMKSIFDVVHLILLAIHLDGNDVEAQVVWPLGPVNVFVGRAQE